MQKPLCYKRLNRDGAIVPLFAILLPIVLVLAAFAVNLASMQLTTTELRVATDVTSHAGGRALNVFQNMDDPRPEAVINALRATVDQYYVLNTVAGKTLTLPSDPSSYIEFYNLGTRTDRLDEAFHKNNIVSYSQARNGTAFNGVGVQANIETDFAFDFTYGKGSLGNFTPTRNSITKQTERDLAVVIDSSGSMLTYHNSEFLTDVLSEMRDRGYINSTEFRIAAGFQEARINGSGLRFFLERNRPESNVYFHRFRYSGRHFQFVNGAWRERFELDIIRQLEQFNLDNPGDSRDIPAMIAYAKSWEGVTPYAGNRKSNFATNSWVAQGGFNDHAPLESRWDYLFRGIQDFVDVLEATPAEERMSLVVFNNQAEAPVRLTSNYQNVLDVVEQIIPIDGTAIEKGMTEGLQLVLEDGVSRPFAEKIIVVMTDGVNSEGGAARVIQGAEDVVAGAEAKNEEITIHTLTFGDGTGISPNPSFPGSSDQPWLGAMVDVARIGNGEHFHAQDALELQARLRQIANIQPTIFTF